VRPTLQSGASGEDVRFLQYGLEQVGFGPFDAVFGPLTESAVRHFQTERGLAIDGIVGRQTWEALLEEI
jgi:peptidoglycan hydrolase-like protein with peptidoglycan-binding domain